MTTAAQLAASTTGTPGFKNRVINGSMVVDQRGSAASPVTIPNGSSAFSVDQFRTYKDTATGVLTAQQSSTAPTGFIKSLLLTASTGFSAGAGDYLTIVNSIEGTNVADLNCGTANAATVTLSFWVRSSITGTYAASLTNSANSRSYVATYTISSANTFEYKTITIPLDTSGTWLTDNGAGMRIRFDLGSGSNYNTTANTWATGTLTRTSACVNWTATTGATFYVTGVQLEKGTTATAFDFRSYGTELALCQRYFWLCNGATYQYSIVGCGEIGGAGMLNITFPVPMRTTPSTISASGSGPYFYYNTVGGARQTGTFTSASISNYGAGTNAMRIITGATGGSGLFFWVDIGSTATLAFSISAEL